MVSSRTESHVVVVGGGLAGLSAAVELSSLGLRVTLVERNAHLGGKMNVLSEKGFTFDMGPTIITLPQVLRGILRRAGKNPADYVQLINLDPQWRCFFDDGTVIDLRGDVETMAASMDRQFPGSGAGAGYREFIAFSRRMMRLSEKVFFYNDLGSALDMMRTPPKEPGVMRDALAMRMHSTVGATLEKMVPEPHLRQLCEHFLQYVGSSPFLAPAILSLIASAQVDHGCWYPMGGTRAVARALERVLRERNVEILTGDGVQRILVEGGRAVGVQLASGRTVKCDAVVSNCDVQRTYRDLIGDAAAASAQRAITKKYEPACSGVVLYLGLNRRYEHLAHHCFLFSKDGKSEFADIYGKGVPASDPTLYLAVPSRSDPSQAPEGGEALYVLVHTAYKRAGQRWEGPGGLLERYKPVILEKLARCGKMPDLASRIVVDRWLTPDGIESMYNAEGGAIYGLASHGKLSGGFKPRNRSTTFKGLYFAGGSVNPGPGVPMVLMSGVTAARAVASDAGITLPRIDLGPGIEPDSITRASASDVALSGVS